MSVPENTMNTIPKISQLSGRVWRFLGCNPGHMTLQGTNIYLVGSGPKRLLIDAGQDGFPEYINSLTGYLKENRVTLEGIVITHWHRDHIGALGDLKNSLVTSIMNSLPPVHKFRRKEPENDDIPEGYTLKPLQDNQQFSIDGATLKVLFTPGHTTDHAALYLQEEKAIFSGDCILGEGTTVFEDLHDYMQSLERILGEKPDIIYPGHGPVVKGPQEKIQYYINHRRQRENQILEALKSAKKPMTAAEIVDVVYTDTPAILKPAAEVNVIHHLEKLVKENRVRREGETFIFLEGKI